MLYEFSLLFKFLFLRENSKTIGTNYLTNSSAQSILVVVVYDAITECSENKSTQAFSYMMFCKVMESFRKFSARFGKSS